MDFLLEEYIDSKNIDLSNLNYNLKLKEQKIPENILDLIRNRAELFYDDLLFNEFRVILIDAPDKKHLSHKIRTLDSLPPNWYLDLHRGFGYSIKTKNKITNRLRNNWTSNYRRDLALKSFKRISSSLDLSGSNYDKINRELIFEDLFYVDKSVFGNNLEFRLYLVDKINKKSLEIPF